MHHLNFFRRHVLFFGCVLICSLVFLFCVIAARQFWNRIERDNQRETSNVAHLLVSHFDAVVRHVDGLLLSILFDKIASTDNEDPNSGFKLNQLLKRHWPQGTSPFGILALSDKNGVVLATNRDYPGQSFDVSKGNSFRFHSNQALHDQSLYISTPVKGRISGQPVVLFSRALRNSNGDFDGMIEASYKVDNFIENISSLNIKDLGIIGIAGFDGISRVRSNAGVISFGDAIPKNPVFSAVLNGEKEGPFDLLSPRDSMRRIGYFAVSKLSPIFVYVGYDYNYLLFEYNKIIGLLGAFWLIFSASIFGSLFIFQRNLQLNRRKQLELLEATNSERQRILTQMHDSIGASIVSHIAQLDRGVDWSGAKIKASQILTELRLLVDSIFVDDVDVTSVLTGVRHRMQGGFGAGGINLIWKANELPSTPLLNAQCALHLRLILMEALSNVVQHSKAKTVVVSFSHDTTSGFVTISIVDDGIGFELGTSSFGRGLTNIKIRTAKLIFPSTVDVDSKPGKGTTVQIRIKWPEEA